MEMSLLSLPHQNCMILFVYRLGDLAETCCRRGKLALSGVLVGFVQNEDKVSNSVFVIDTSTIFSMVIGNDLELLFLLQ